MESSQKRGRQVLPPEIWQIIACYLGPCKWARVARMCKATYHLQLDPVHIDGQHCDLCSKAGERGVTWLLERAQSAQKMKLMFPTSSAGQQATARAVMQHPSGFSKLTGLVIGADTTENPEDSNHVMMAVASVLVQTCKLKYLRIAIDELACLPRLSYIQGLQLYVSAPTISRLVPAILSLGTLQTLELRLSKYPQAPPQLHLDLHALPNLQSLVLYDVAPNSLVLAKCTVVHVTLFSLYEAQSGVWDSVSTAIKTFRVWSCDEVISLEEHIPQWLLKPASVDTLGFHLKAFGEEDCGAIYLTGAFTTAKRLGLDCLESLFVELPRNDCHWEVVNFHTDGELHVDIDRAVLLCCPAFSFKFKRLRNTDLIGSFWAFGQSSRPITLEMDDEDVNHIHSPCSNADSLDLHSDAYNNCRCGACSDCCCLDSFDGIRLPWSQWP